MDSATRRHRLHGRLEEVLGPEPADTLMTHLPTVHWEDLATKQDLAALRDDLVREMDTRFALMRADLATTRSDMESLEHRLTASFRAEMNDQTRTMVFALVAAVLTVVLVTFGAAGLVLTLRP